MVSYPTDGCSAKTPPICVPLVRRRTGKTKVCRRLFCINFSYHWRTLQLKELFQHLASSQLQQLDPVYLHLVQAVDQDLDLGQELDTRDSNLRGLVDQDLDPLHTDFIVIDVPSNSKIFASFHTQG